VLAWLALRIAQPGTSAAAEAGLILVATMLAMAIVEHWLLVLPLQSSALWRWAMRNRKAHAPNDPAVQAHDDKLLHAR
jgi:Protein of unknown function (DUF3623)